MNHLHEFIKQDLGTELQQLLRDRDQAREQRKQRKLPTTTDLKNYQNKLAKPIDWSPPRHVVTPFRDHPQYVQFIKVRSNLEPGVSFSATVGDGVVSIKAFFKFNAAGNHEDPQFVSALRQVRVGTILCLKKYRFRFLGTCYKGFSEGLKREDQDELALSVKSLCRSNLKSLGYYSNVATMGGYRLARDLPPLTEPSLEIHDFQVLGGDDHIYGETQDVSKDPEIKNACDTLPASPIALPHPEQWSRVFVNAIAEIWYNELAWLVFSQNLTTEENTNLFETKTTFSRKFRPSKKPILKAAKIAMQNVFEPIYEEDATIGRLFEIKRVFNDTKPILESRSQNLPPRLSYIPGTHRPMPTKGSRYSISYRSSSSAVSSQLDGFGTQSFATQFPARQRASNPSASDLVNMDLERRVSRFKLGEIADQEYTNFCEIIRSFYDKVKDGCFQEKQELGIIYDHISDFYATQTLNKLTILRSQSREASEPAVKPNPIRASKQTDAAPEPLPAKEATATPSKTQNLIGLERLKAMLAAAKSPNTSIDNSKLVSTPRSAGSLTPTTLEPREKHGIKQVVPATSRRHSAIPNLRSTEVEKAAPPRVQPEVLLPRSEQKSLPTIKANNKHRHQSSPMVLDKQLEPPSSTRISDASRAQRTRPTEQEKSESAPKGRRREVPPPVDIEKRSPKIKVEEQEPEFIQEDFIVKPEPPAPGPIQRQPIQTEPDRDFLPDAPAVVPAQPSEPEDLLTRITRMLDLIHKEQEVDRLLPERTRVPKDQAAMLSKSSSLWPPPKVELQKHSLATQPKRALKGAPPRKLQYPRDFEPYHSTIESWSTEGPRELEQNANTTDVRSEPQAAREQHVFTLENQPEATEEDQEVDWSPTPPSQLKQPGAVRMVEELQDDEAEEEDSDAESILNNEPPPGSSMEPPVEPSQLAPTQMSLRAGASRAITSSAAPARGKSSPPRARPMAFGAGSSPPPSSMPATPHNETDEEGDKEMIGREEAEKEVDEGEDEKPEEEIQVLQTQTQPSQEDDEDVFETAGESQEGTLPERQEQSPERIISSSQLSRPTTPTASPNATKRKADELDSSPVKAGSHASPRIVRIKALKTDDESANQNLGRLTKNLEAAARAGKAVIRKTLNISDAELDPTNLNSEEERIRRDRESFLN
ncbi:hypothetical protein H072_3812 [Dactylellina haptotyla CBS 200.50]|uniref:Uncharacterized protein n=1 Tax=Dactylellina haptotyla (strain CBS 200.50) TaxID=1284197 RepID=S8C358_DACHA|nr:hypothetical protein H072_3812 [Dactylellina haptotyla CBS 200.50]